MSEHREESKVPSIHIHPSTPLPNLFPLKTPSYETTDALPESSTCSSTLFLPHYASAKVCEEKLRYAAYNCVAIDTDMSPWEE